MKKTLQEELRELESKKAEIEKELDKKNKIKEEQDKIKKEKWEKKIKRLLDSCEGNLIEDWYDTDNLGYSTFKGILENGCFSSYELTILEEAIEHTEQCKQEEIKSYDGHKEKLSNFIKELENIKLTNDAKSRVQVQEDLK